MAVNICYNLCYAVEIHSRHSEINMAILTNYIRTQAQLKELQQQLEKMQDDPRLQAELEFKTKLQALMEQYGKSVRDVVQLLSPEKAEASTASNGRAKRRLKRYTNPHTNEIVETRGGNHKTVKAWKDQYGEEVVQSWSEFVE